MQKLTCMNCGERIELGERRRPVANRVAHDHCIVARSTPVEWNHDDRQMKLDDLVVGFQADFGRDLPEWVIGAANAGQLRDGVVGHLSMMYNGSIQFREAN